jgi:hypothetical protein
MTGYSYLLDTSDTDMVECSRNNNKRIIPDTRLGLTSFIISNIGFLILIVGSVSFELTIIAYIGGWACFSYYVYTFLDYTRRCITNKLLKDEMDSDCDTSRDSNDSDVSDISDISVESVYKDGPEPETTKVHELISQFRGIIDEIDNEKKED